MRWPSLLLLHVLLLAASPAGASPPPEPSACPEGLAAGTTCWRLRDASGAFVTIARPANPHGGLIVHSHGGPRLDAPTATITDEDLLRFREFLAEGCHRITGAAHASRWRRW